MTITLSDKYTLFTATNSFNDFYNKFNAVFDEHKHQNLVVNLSNLEVSEKEIQLLEKFAHTQIENHQSFAVVVPKVDADVFEEALNVVPTTTEAEAMIDMDEITRDLGF